MEYKTQTKPFAKDKNYLISDSPKQMVCSGRNEREALSCYLKRGRHGLGLAWTFTRCGEWVVAVNDSGRTLERRILKIKEYKQYA